MNSHQFFNEILPDAVGEVNVLDEHTAHCTCPGTHLHTTDTALKHTTAFWNNGRPHVHCHHQSCAAEVDAFNRGLRQRYAVRHDGSEGHSARVGNTRHRELRDLAVANKDWVLQEYHWPLAEIAAASPFPIDPIPEAQTILHLSLFETCDTVWIGELNYTGKPWSVKNFLPCDRWMDRACCLRPLSPFVCPSVFKPGSWSRSDGNVAASRFLVVESDILIKDEIGAIFRLLQKHLTLRAVVDTGNRSLHGWFDRPSADAIADLKAFLPALGCDPKMFGTSQPCRLAGQKRDNGNLQRLVYLNPEISLEN